MATSVDDLAGRGEYVKHSSSFGEHLESLNRDFASRGFAPVVIEPADENLEAEDILEMVDAGLVDVTVADKHVADFWVRLAVAQRERRGAVGG